MIDVTTATIQVINGDPGGIKICRLAGKTLIAVVIPREQLSEAKRLPDIPSRGVYYLLDDNKGRLKRVYAGQTVQGIARLDDHYSKKSWWNKAVMFLAPDSEFSMDIVSGLEAACIAYISEHGAYESDNAANPKPYVSPYSEAFINSLHEDILFRMSLLGFDLDSVGDDAGKHPVSELHTFRRGVQGRGVYRADEGVFEVLAGSQIDMTVQPGTAKKPTVSIIAMRQSLMESGAIKRDKDGLYRTTEGVRFSSPSAAAVFVLGGSANGWSEWVNDKGQTLSSLYREGANHE